MGTNVEHECLTKGIEDASFDSAHLAGLGRGNHKCVRVGMVPPAKGMRAEGFRKQMPDDIGAVHIRQANNASIIGRLAAEAARSSMLASATRAKAVAANLRPRFGHSRLVPLRLESAICSSGSALTECHIGNSVDASRLRLVSFEACGASPGLKLREVRQRCGGGCNHGEMYAQNMMFAPR